MASYVRSQFGFRYAMRGWAVLILLAFVMAFRLASVLALTKLTFQTR